MPFPLLSEGLHSLLEAIVESSEDAIFSKTLEGLVLSWNSGAERLYGYRAQEMIGRSVSVLVPEDRRPELAAILRQLAQGQRIEHFETVRRRKDGRLVDVSVTTSPLRDTTGQLIGASSITRDMTERKQAQERQRLLEEASAMLVASLDHQITLHEITQLLVPALADYCRLVIVDEHHQITDIVVHHRDPEKNALVQELYDHYKDKAAPTYGIQKLLASSRPELISEVSESVLETVRDDPELLHILKVLGLHSYMGVPLLVGGKTIGAITFSSIHPHRSYTHADLAFAQELARRIAFVLENARLHRETQAEIAERKRAQAQQHVLQERLLALATTDPVTALPNHRELMSRLEQELERAQRYRRPCCVLFVDLDHFKALNDGYGHAVGDAVLGEFADLVRRPLRGIDTLGRWGGEEFVVILPEVQVEEALPVAEAMRAAVAAHIFQVASGIHLTCSIGLASSPVHAQARDDLLRAADEAMHGAKHFGRNQVRLAHDPAVRTLFGANQALGGREEAMLIGMAEALVALVEVRDHLTGSHCQHVADLVYQLALALGWPAPEAQMLTLAGRLHDLGKVAVPDSILQKPGGLTSQERALMQQHAAIGAEIVSHIPALRPLAPVIRAHHERWDGQGYPDQLVREAIPLGARLLSAVDAYQAMITDRPYRRARAPADALGELRRCAGSQFDPQVVDVLLRLLCEPGEEVQ